MDTSEKDSDPGNNPDMDDDRKRPNIWGPFYLILGLLGLGFSVYAIIFSIGTVPLYGTVVASVLLGFLSLLILIYGYRIMRRDI